jgi:hypothetical protein
VTALAVVALTALSQADTVLLLRSSDETWAPLEERVAAELQASGFLVKGVESQIDPGGDIPAQLWQRCQAEGVLAALWFNARADGRVDAWVADRVTGKAVLRTYEQPSSGAERARLALRAVELLHASLLEVRLMTQQQKAAVPEVARAAVEKRLTAEEESKPHLIFGTGVGAIFSSGLAHPQPMLEIQIGWAFSARFAAEVQVQTSVFPSQVHDAVSQADVGIALFRLVGAWAPWRYGPFALALLAATGTAMVWASGDTNDQNLETRLDVTATWVVGGGLQASWRFNEGVRVQLLGIGSAGVPAVAVAIAGDTRAVLLRPVIDVMVRMEFE